MLERQQGKCAPASFKSSSVSSPAHFLNSSLVSEPSWSLSILSKSVFALGRMRTTCFPFSSAQHAAFITVRSTRKPA